MSSQTAVDRLGTRRRRSNPEIPAKAVLGVSVLAWLAVIGLSLPTGPVGSPMHQHGAGGVPGDAAAAAASVMPFTVGWIGMWAAMTAAMMWPLLIPAVDRVSRAVFARWRLVLTATTVATVTVLWLALGLAAATMAWLAAVPAGSVWWQLAFLAVAGVAWGSARRNRLLARCAKLPAIAPSGVRGVRGAVRVGLVSWRRCALLCGPLMVAMAVGHDPLVLIAASASVWWEAWHPRAFRDRVPLALIIVAGLGAILGGMLS